jgi:hypothetical protein
MVDEETLKDMVRIPEAFREGLPNRSICELKVGARSAIVFVRGWPGYINPDIAIDEAVREKLGVEIGESHVFKVRRLTRLGQFVWFLRASDPAVRLPAWLSVISLILGVIALGLGAWPIIFRGS